jgi:hypothetical protein
VTTGPSVTTGPTKPSKPSKPSKPPPPTKTPSFLPFFCSKPPTSNTIGGGCSHDLSISANRPFFFVIRAQNIPAGVTFSANLVIKGTTRAVAALTFPKTSGAKVNRLVSPALGPVGDVGRGITLVAVIRANGQATTCGGKSCTQDDDASVTFT